MSTGLLKQDPVCGMMVDEQLNEHHHDGIAYAFCSAQCQQRFIETPRLYVGTAGKQSVKQQGLLVLKHRKMTLKTVPTKKQVNEIINAINALMGIQAVSIKDKVLIVKYDLLQTTEAQIEEVLKQNGYALSKHWLQRMRRAISHVLEENQCSALSANINSAKTCHKK